MSNICYLLKADKTRTPLREFQFSQLLLSSVALITIDIEAFQQYKPSFFGMDCNFKSSLHLLNEATYQIQIIFLKAMDPKKFIFLEAFPELYVKLKMISSNLLNLINHRLKGKQVVCVDFSFVMDRTGRIFLLEISSCKIWNKMSVEKACIVEQEVPEKYNKWEQGYNLIQKLQHSMVFYSNIIQRHKRKLLNYNSDYSSKGKQNGDCFAKDLKMSLFKHGHKYRNVSNRFRRNNTEDLSSTLSQQTDSTGANNANNCLFNPRKLEKKIIITLPETNDSVSTSRNIREQKDCKKINKTLDQTYDPEIKRNSNAHTKCQSIIKRRYNSINYPKNNDLKKVNDIFEYYTPEKCKKKGDKNKNDFPVGIHTQVIIFKKNNFFKPTRISHMQRPNSAIKKYAYGHRKSLSKPGKKL